MNTTWLAGFFDGAGHVSTGDRTQIVFTRPIRYNALMMQLCEFLEAMGYHPTLATQGGSIRVMVGRKRDVEELARTLSTRVKSNPALGLLALAIGEVRK